MNAEEAAPAEPSGSTLRVTRQGITVEVGGAADLPPFLARKFEQLVVMICYCLRALADFRSEMLINKLMSYLADFGVIMRYYNSDEYTGEPADDDDQ